ncbi:ABC transporter substrate-binding protein [Nocardioides caldifontis]|uniref:ABC transporter substrate-binding protein n=1 Tax=Nocardioides caldifontis TaxID=2588938 RepID=UPI0011DF89B1|nr:ABC transporter substrate-binding protein [Nocardioides caldifontis]
MAAVAGVGLISSVLAGCGGDDGGGSGGDGDKFTQVRMSYDNDDFMNQMTWRVADEMFWPELGFTEPAEVTASEEYMAGLIGGDVWVAQGESDVIWAALAEGSVPLKIIGVAKDTEAWWLGVREGVDPDNLEGLKISGGPVGDRNITVARSILEEMGVDPDDLEFVSVKGGSDERLQAMLAGQIDVAQLQPRHLTPLTEAGGTMIHKEFREVPQEVWVVRAETLEDHREEVCAYVKGRIQAFQYASEGETFTDNRDEIVEMVKEAGLEPSKDEIAEWEQEMETQLALEGGATEEAFDEWNQDMIENGNVPEDFDWRDHVDFSCLTEAQEELGLPVEPGDI